MSKHPVKSAAKKPAKVDHRLSYDAIATLVRDNNVSGQSDALLIALIYKESRFDPTVKSNAANSTATGLMQMTKTAVIEINRVNKTTIDFADMTSGGPNIAAGSAYLKIRIKRAGGLSAGLDGYGTGPGYSTSILAGESQLKTLPKDGDPMQVLSATIGKF